MDAVGFALVATAVVTVGGVLIKSRPFRWLGRTLIGAPMTAWVHKTVTAANADRFDSIEKELHPNGGMSALDRMTSRIDGVNAELSRALTVGFGEAATHRADLGVRLDDAARLAALAAAAVKQSDVTIADLTRKLDDHLLEGKS